MRPDVIWKLRLRELIDFSLTIGVNVLMGGNPRELFGLIHHIGIQQK